jgi:hypothetical protein
MRAPQVPATDSARTAPAQPVEAASTAPADKTSGAH